jgi:hypothetical protein
MGMDFWLYNPDLASSADQERNAERDALRRRVAELEERAAAG